MEALRRVLERHYQRLENQVRFKANGELPRSAEGIESPYDPEALFSSRREISWTGYQVHLSETCEPEEVHLITNVETTPAPVHESQKTKAIHQSLAEKALAPKQHLVDSAYVDAEVLISSQDQFGISLVGPGRVDNSWQARTEGGYHRYCFTIDWEQRKARCPQGNLSKVWKEGPDRYGPRILIVFDSDDCRSCPARSLCTRAKTQPRRLRIQPRPQYEALQAARQLLTTEDGRNLYKARAGVEGTISQGVRGFGLRQCRYWGLAKTHLQHLATAAAINLDRIGAWFQERPQAKTRVSRFACLAPLAA